MQRLHVDDLVGHVLDEGRPSGPSSISRPSPRFPRRSRSARGRRSTPDAPGEILHPEREPMHCPRGAQKANDGEPRLLGPVPASSRCRPKWRDSSNAEVVSTATTEARPRSRRATSIVQSWDTASKVGNPTNDYSVCTTWLEDARTTTYLLDVLRKSDSSFPELLTEEIVSHAGGAWEPDDVSHRGRQLGHLQLIQDLRR